MSTQSKKKKVFGTIAAYKTLTESMPKLKSSSSMPSINNNGDTITFLCDLIKSLIGFESLQETITDILVYNLKDIETEIKSALKLELKSIVSCSINPSLPDFIKSNGTGIKYVTKKVDFTGLMFIDPNSSTGQLLYNDLTPNLINSSDFNSFLYQTIQNNGSIEGWPQSSTNTNQILTFSFKSTDITNVDPNNTITVKAHQNYDNKSLTDLNNDFIDSINLFNVEKLLNNLIDMVFGSISQVANKSLKQLESVAKINTAIDKIVNSDNKDIINDKYFTSTNIEHNKELLDAKNRKAGIKPINTSGKINTSVSIQSINTANQNIRSAATQIQKKAQVTNTLNNIGNEVSSFSNNAADHKAIKLNFIQELVNNLIKSIVNSILSPKVITIFIINYKIIYGPNATYKDAMDFLKQNKNLIHNITKRISSLIIKTLLNIAMKKITALVSEAITKIQIEKSQANTTQLLSLLGVSQEIIRNIKGLT